MFIRKLGKGSALNEGMCHTESDLVCVLDADCILHKNALANAVRHFSNEDVAAIGGRFLVRTDDSSLLETIQFCEYMELVLRLQEEAYRQSKG